MSRKVLIFTYYWPPAGGVAVQRFLKFAKYLPEFGWQPIIITVENGSYPFTDESQVKEVPSSLQVYRTKTFEPFEFYNLLRGKRGKAVPAVAVGGNRQKSFFEKITEHIRANYFIPDARKGWIPYALKKAEEVLKYDKIDAIVTTGPPHSTHLIGLELKKRTGIKWLADFRDPWTKNLMIEFLPRTASANKKDKELEDAVLQSADAITVISEGMKGQFSNSKSSPEVIYNGFDEADMNVESISTDGYFALRHVGNLILSMNVPELWTAIAELRNENEKFKQSFRLEIVGDAHPLIRSEFEKYGLADAIHDTGYVDHSKAVAYMKGASCLLFLVSNVKYSEVLMSGKIFEYLATRNRILSIGPVNGNADHLLHDCEREGIIAFEDKAKIKITLFQYFEEWMNGTKFQYTGNKHLFYTRQSQCRRLAQILDKLV